MAAQLSRRRELLRAGEKPLGWKVAFSPPAWMERLGTTGALVGYLMDRALLTSGATVPVSDWTKPVAEPEIAVHIGKDLLAGADRDTVKAAIAGVGPAIELADLERPPSAEDLESVLSGNIFHRNVVVGPRDVSRAGCVLEGLSGHILRNGTEVAQTSDPQAATGELIDIVRQVADMLGAFGEKLRAGEVIITGSIVPPLFLEPGEEMTFRLDPIGVVSVRFAAKASGAS